MKLFILCCLLCVLTKGQLTDQTAYQVQQVWKQSFPDAMLLPQIGLPSVNKQNWFTLTHTMGNHPTMNLNGINCVNPLCVNALYSAEYTGGNYLNLYEIMVEDAPGVNGNPSAAAVYVQSLAQNGLSVNGVHFHWYGTKIPVTAVHHSSYGMDPIEFSQRTIQAIQVYQNYRNSLKWW